MKPQDMPPMPPALLTTSEALEFAAAYLERLVVDFRLIVLIVKADGAFLDSPGLAATLPELRKRTIEPDMQIAAMRAAAKTIREAAFEERLIAARVAAGAGIAAERPKS